MKKLFFLLIAVMALSFSAKGAWEDRTFPFNSPYISHLKASLYTSNIYALPQDGKAYKSTDGGNNWIDLNYPNPMSTLYDIEEIGTEIYVIVGTYIRKTTDNGATWSVVNNGTGYGGNYPRWIKKIGTYFIIGTNAGLYYTTNPLGNWTISPSVPAVEINSPLWLSSSGYLYVCPAGNRVYRSTNGYTWSSVNLFPNGVTSLASMDNTRFYGVYNAGAGNRIYSSTIGGTPTQEGSGIWDQSLEGLSVTSNSNGVMAFVRWVPGINPGGAFFKPASGVWSYSNYGLGDWTSAEISATTTDFYIPQVDGLMKTSNNGTYWYGVLTDIHQDPIYSVMYDGTNLYAGGYFSRFYISSNNGVSWRMTGDGYIAGAIQKILKVGTDMYIGTQFGLMKSVNGGYSFSYINNNLNEDVRDIYIDPAVPTTIYTATAAGLRKSVDGGNSWTTCLNLPYGYDGVLAISKSGTNLIAGTDNGLYVSANDNGPWVNAIGATTRVPSIAVTGPTVFVCAATMGVYKSTNNGTNFTAYNNGLPAGRFASTVSINGTNVYLGTYDMPASDNWVFKTTTTTTADWQALCNNGLPFNKIRGVAGVNSTVFAGCEGFSTVRGSVFHYTTPSSIAVPTLVSPLNNAVNVPLLATLSWNAVPNATSYQIEIADAVTSALVYSTTTNNTSIQYQFTQYLKRFKWRVKAVDDCSGLMGNWSAYRYFTTINIPCSGYHEPPNGTTVSSVNPVQFSWDPIPYIDYYTLTISPVEPTGPDIVIEPISGTSTSVLLQGNVKYNWSITPHQGSVSKICSVWEFKTELPPLGITFNPSSQNTCPGYDINLVPPTIINGIPGSTYSYSWTPANYLVDASVESPITSGLPANTTVVFTCTVTESPSIRQATQTQRVVVGPEAYFELSQDWVRVRWSQSQQVDNLNSYIINVVGNPNDYLFHWIDENGAEVPGSPTNGLTVLAYPVPPPPSSVQLYVWGEVGGCATPFMLPFSITVTQNREGVEDKESDPSVNNQNSNSLSVYPNPVSEGRLNVSFRFDEDLPSDISIVNSLGQSVYNTIYYTGTVRDASLDIGGLPAGMYCLVVKSGNNVMNKRFIIK